MYPWAFRYESSIWRPWERMAHGTALIRKQTSERVVKVNSRWIKDLTENPTLKEAQENTWKLTGKPLRTIEYKARKKRTNASDYIKMKSLLQITRIKTKTEMICLALRSGASWEEQHGRRDGLETLSSPSDRIQLPAGRVCFWVSINASVLPIKS